MYAVPLKRLSYQDNMRTIIDAVNSNFQLLEVLFNTQKGVAFFGNVFVEYGTAPLCAGVKFLLTARYINRPLTILGLETTNFEDIADNSKITLVAEPVQESDGTFQEINVYATGVSKPIDTASITVLAICVGKAVS